MSRDIQHDSFVWDLEKEKINIRKHNVDFVTASGAFFDNNCIIAIDEKHSGQEKRFFCIGKVKNRIMTVRFTYRNNLVRIFGGGYWRKGRDLYAKNKR